MTANDTAASSSIGNPKTRQTHFALTVAFEVYENAFVTFCDLVSENAARSVAAEPGCLRFDVLVPESQIGTMSVFLYEIYRDRTAFDLHLASDHYQQFDAETRAFVLSKTVVTYGVRENAKDAGTP